MNRLVVSVCSDDALALPGVRALIGSCPGLAIVPEARLRDARVALLVAEDFDSLASRMLARIATTSRARVILVVNRVLVPDLATLARRRVVSILRRACAAADHLLAAVEIGVRSPLDRDDVLARLRAAVEPAGGNAWQPIDGDTPRFTAVEVAVLRLLADGHDTTAVATRLAYSERRVKHIVQRLLTRLGLRNRVHAVAYAMRVGVL